MIEALARAAARPGGDVFVRELKRRLAVQSRARRRAPLICCGAAFATLGAAGWAHGQPGDWFRGSFWLAGAGLSLAASAALLGGALTRRWLLAETTLIAAVSLLVGLVVGAADKQLGNHIKVFGEGWILGAVPAAIMIRGWRNGDREIREIAGARRRLLDLQSEQAPEGPTA